MEISAPHEDVKSEILLCYPDTYVEREQKEKIPEFVFPCTFNVTAVELFSFALTNTKGELTFGFCRHAQRAESALVIMSALPWHEFFYKMLNLCGSIMNSAEEETGLLYGFLQKMYNAKLPPPGHEFSLEYSHDGKVFSSATPDPTRLPSMPENRNLMEYYNFVSIDNMITIFFCMLKERRVIVTSNKLSVLSACVQAANALLYPFSWQHPFIPVLPSQMIEYITAPMPFLFGVPQVLLKRKPAHEIKEVVILDVDNNSVRNPFTQEDIIPHEVVSNLKKSLKIQNKMGDQVSRAFLQAMVHLIGGYRDALRYRQGEKITFDREAFVNSRSTNLQPFLRDLLEVQMFQTFKDDRLELLNGGKGYSDEFEMECVAFTSKSNRRFSALETVKKDGGALIKKVKSKANPAVKDAMKNVVDGSKTAGKNVKTKVRATINAGRSKLKDNPGDQFREDSSGTTHSAPSSPTQSRRNSMGVGMLGINSYQTLNNSNHHQLPLRQNTDLGFTPVLKYERFDPAPSGTLSLSPGEGPISPADSEDLNLMQEIDKVFNTQKPSAVLYNSSNKIATFDQNRDQQQKERKASVGDLINLANDTAPPNDDIEFDPLVNKSHQSGTHKKLSRSDASLGNDTLLKISSTEPHSFLYGSGRSGIYSNGGSNSDVRNNSQGKYENYVPAGGAAHQAPFKQFVNSMHDTRPAPHLVQQYRKNSSEDLLNDYGLQGLNNLSLLSSQVKTPGNSANHSARISMNSGNSLNSFVTGAQQNSFPISTPAVTLANSPVFHTQYNGLDHSRAGLSLGTAPQPPPRPSANPYIGQSSGAILNSDKENARQANSGNYNYGGSPDRISNPNKIIHNGHHLSQNSQTTQSILNSSKGNNSFLFSPPIQSSIQFQIGGMDQSVLPVNQKLVLESATAGRKSSNEVAPHSYTNNNNHFLSDLDPLYSSSNGGIGMNKPVLERTNVTPNHVPSGLSPRQAPAIPPRSKDVKKKQWEKFD